MNAKSKIETTRLNELRIVKTTAELSKNEKEQLAEMIRESYHDADDSFINARTSSDVIYDVAMHKHGDRILAACYYHVSKQNTPFSDRSVDTFHYGQALKSREFKGNLIQSMGHWYARKYWSPLYIVKDVVGVTVVVNPRVMEQFVQIYKRHLPIGKSKMPVATLDFLKRYLEERGIFLDLDEYGCANVSGLSRMDITDIWESRFKTRTNAINELFEERGIIYRENGKIYRSSKHIVCVGVRSINKRRFQF